MPGCTDLLWTGCVHFHKSSHYESEGRRLVTRSGVLPLVHMYFIPCLCQKAVAKGPRAQTWITNLLNLSPWVDRRRPNIVCGNSKIVSQFHKDAVILPSVINIMIFVEIRNQLQMYLGFFHYILWDAPAQLYNKWCHRQGPPGSGGILCVLTLCPDYNGVSKPHYSTWKVCDSLFSLDPWGTALKKSKVKFWFIYQTRIAYIQGSKCSFGEKETRFIPLMWRKLTMEDSL